MEPRKKSHLKAYDLHAISITLYCDIKNGVLKI
jgi:hypothetical protein